MEFVVKYYMMATVVIGIVATAVAVASLVFIWTSMLVG